MRSRPFGTLLLLIGLCLTPATALAQDSLCVEEGTASAELDIGNVRAALYNNGNLFFAATDLYEVPEGSGKKSIYASNLWIGGMAGGELRMAAATYHDFEFRPGPLSADGTAPTDCAPYDRLWTVSLADIAQYEQTGDATADLAEWPVYLGAPVVDGDGIPDNYNLAGGDRPEILGEQSVWWVMNDVAAPHRTTGAPPIGLEAKVMAYAFDQVGRVGNTTFYRYTFTYRGDVPLEDTYFGFWVDPDLGDRYDDYVGSDTTLGLGYVYNADDFDETRLGDSPGYEERPPALGYVLVDGPEVDPGVRDGTTDERMGFTHFVYYSSDSTPQDIPNTAVQYYNYLQALWRDGRPVTFGGSGRGFSQERAYFMWPADPPAFWSEDNMDGDGLRNAPSDRRFVVSTGPFTLTPGETETLTLAIVWSQAGPDDDPDLPRRLASHRKLERDAAALLRNPEAFTTPLVERPTPAGPSTPEGFAWRGLYPNPAREAVHLTLDVPEAGTVTVAVYDVLGRRVRTAQAIVGPGRQMVTVDVAGLAAGVHLARAHLEADGLSEPWIGSFVVAP